MASSWAMRFFVRSLAALWARRSNSLFRSLRVALSSVGSLSLADAVAEIGVGSMFGVSKCESVVKNTQQGISTG